MALSAFYNAVLQVKEDLSLGLDLGSGTRVTHEISGLSATLKDGSIPPATKVFSDTRNLSAGADTLDLQALTGPLSTTVDFTGLKLQLVLVVASENNTDAITVKPAATNGYNLFGGASDQETLAAGDFVFAFRKDSLPDVAAAAKDVAFSSPDADAEYSIILVAG